MIDLFGFDFLGIGLVTLSSVVRGCSWGCRAKNPSLLHASISPALKVSTLGSDLHATSLSFWNDSGGESSIV